MLPEAGPLRMRHCDLAGLGWALHKNTQHIKTKTNPHFAAGIFCEVWWAQLLLHDRLVNVSYHGLSRALVLVV